MRRMKDVEQQLRVKLAVRETRKSQEQHEERGAKRVN